MCRPAASTDITIWNAINHFIILHNHGMQQTNFQRFNMCRPAAAAAVQADHAELQSVTDAGSDN